MSSHREWSLNIQNFRRRTPLSFGRSLLSSSLRSSKRWSWSLSFALILHLYVLFFFFFSFRCSLFSIFLFFNFCHGLAFPSVWLPRKLRKIKRISILCFAMILFSRTRLNSAQIKVERNFLASALSGCRQNLEKRKK